MLLMMLHSHLKQRNVHYCFTDCAVEGECESCCGSFNFEDKEFTVKRGDYAPVMEKVAYYLKKAQVRTRDTKWVIVSVQTVLFQLFGTTIRTKSLNIKLIEQYRVINIAVKHGELLLLNCWSC